MTQFQHARTYTAGGNIYACRFVKGNSTTAGSVVQSAAATDKTIGVSAPWQSGPPGVTGTTADLAAASGDPISVLELGQEALLELGGTVAAWGWIVSDADGKGVANTAATGGQLIAARALEGGASGDRIRVVVLQHMNAEDV